MKRKNILGIFVGLFLIIIFFGFVGATIYKINPSTGATIDRFGVSKDVSNNHPTLAIMVPTGTALEWTQFRANAPASVNIVDSQCTLGSQCPSGEYCHATSGCLDLPVCAEANTGTGYNAQESTEDRWGDCGTLNCYDGNCIGGAYHCGCYTDNLRHNCGVDYLCGSIPQPNCLCQLFCFIPKTKVLMGDGTYKEIINIEKGEFVQGETQLNEVLGMHIHDVSKIKLYSFNEGEYFVTEEHPFKTITGWKAINPKKLYEEDENLFRLLDPKVLKVGDILLTENGLVLIKSLKFKYVEKEMKVYNLMLEGDHTYYADGYLVHNAKD